MKQNRNRVTKHIESTLASAVLIDEPQTTQSAEALVSGEADVAPMSTESNSSVSSVEQKTEKDELLGYVCGTPMYRSTFPGRTDSQYRELARKFRPPDTVDVPAEAVPDLREAYDAFSYVNDFIAERDPLNGNYLNEKTFDELVRKFGDERCIAQAILLPDRFRKNPNLNDPARVYVSSVRGDWPEPNWPPERNLRRNISKMISAADDFGNALPF